MKDYQILKIIIALYYCKLSANHLAMITYDLLSFLFISLTLRLINLKTRTAMNAKISMFVFLCLSDHAFVII